VTTQPWQRCPGGCVSSVCNPNALPDGCEIDPSCIPCQIGSECPNDGNPCHDTQCASGACIYPNKPNNSLCSDSNACNGTERCQNGSCQQGNPPSCNDSIPCTADLCDPNVPGGCTHAPNDALCNDGHDCTGDTCGAAGCLHVINVAVCDDAAYFRSVIGGILAEAGRPIDPAAIDVVDGYVGRGYALSRPEEIDRIAEVARAEGLVLDPVYTGKAFHGLACELVRDHRRFGERVVFLHTGGIFGLLAQAAEVAERLA
jgi:hypothetical protein